MGVYGEHQELVESAPNREPGEIVEMVLAGDVPEGYIGDFVLTAVDQWCLDSEPESVDALLAVMTDRAVELASECPQALTSVGSTVRAWVRRNGDGELPHLSVFREAVAEALRDEVGDVDQMDEFLDRTFGAKPRKT